MATNEETFRRLYNEHHRAVLAYFLRRTDSDSAYECTEDVYLVVWRKLDAVPAGEGALPWLYAVARRVLSNQRRGAARRARLNTRVLGLGPLWPTGRSFLTPASPSWRVARWAP